MVQTDKISKQFHDPKKGLIQAVDRVDFCAQPGQITGLLGVNGAGKTTMLRMLSTVIRPTEGTAIVAGHDVKSEAAKVRAKIGFISTGTALYGRLTGREMLEYFGGLYGYQGQSLKTQIEKAIATTESGEFADQLCDKMSTGQKQRIGIARAILHEPEVLFLDEPTSGLDILSSQSILGFVESARDAGKTVVFSTHIMSEVERLCDQITLIHNGVVCGSGTLEDLKSLTGSATLEQAFLALVRPVEEASA
ncbi:MAG: ATP-binding cassette domain-containing protein [Fimbriimonadaceae bacterium]